MTVNHTFDSATGRPTGIDSENAAFETLQDLSLQFDVLGNLTNKQDQSRTEGGGSKNLTELYYYDGLNRLDYVTLNGTTTLDLGYDALGNITSKQAWTPGGSPDVNSNVGSYSYGPKPHAVTSAGGASYIYDANGSMLSGDGRMIVYGVHNKPTYFGRGASTLHVYYGPNRNRYKRIDDVSDPNEKETHYVGNIERIYSSSQTITKRYLDGEVIATRTETSSAISEEVAFLLKDHLGSTHMIVDGAGSIVQGMSFDPYGRRRADTSFASLTDTQIFMFNTSETTKGYTGHEGLDPIGLVHMNGRVFDPTLGRFLSADPYIQSSANTQNFNRYSYVLNNPMSYSDPSGHFFVSLFATAVLAKAGLDGAVAAVLILGAAGAADAPIQGANFFDAFRSGFLQGVTAGAFTAIGAGANLANMSWGAAAKMGLAYGSVGGISSVLQGGKFGHGFLSAGVNPFLGKGLSGEIGRQLGSGGRAMTQIVAAGTISRATGGKFANGAAFSAFSMAVQGAFGPAADTSPDKSKTIENLPEDPQAVFDEAMAASEGNPYTRTSVPVQFEDVIAIGRCDGSDGCQRASIIKYATTVDEAQTFLNNNGGAVLIDGLYSNRAIFLFRTATAPQFYPYKDSAAVQRGLVTGRTGTQLTGVENVIQTLSHQGAHHRGHPHSDSLWVRERKAVEFYRRNL